MVYYSSKCPNCNMILERGTNPQKSIGTPIIQCPFCKNWFKSYRIKEYAALTSMNKALYLCDGYFIGTALLIAIVFSVIVKSGFGMLAFPLLCILFGYFTRSSKKFEEEYADSVERCKCREYLDTLKEYGYEIPSDIYEKSVGIDKFEGVNSFDLNFYLTNPVFVSHWKSNDVYVKQCVKIHNIVEQVKEQRNCEQEKLSNQNIKDENEDKNFTNEEQLSESAQNALNELFKIFNADDLAQELKEEDIDMQISMAFASRKNLMASENDIILIKSYLKSKNQKISINNISIAIDKLFE